MIQAIWDFIASNAATNQFLTGGAVLGCIGVLVAYLRKVPGSIWAWFKRRIVIEIDIPDRDEVFNWLDGWLAEHKYQKRCRLVTVYSSKKKHNEGYDDCTPADQIKHKRPKIFMSPAPGLHYLFYKGRLVILSRERKDGSDQKGSMTFGFRETFNIKIFSRNKQLIIDLITEARELAYPPEDDRISVYMPNYGSWNRTAKKIPRPIESVILDGNLTNQILEDVKEFQSSEKWYNGLGIPYRRGYLLYGPPGNGKSSLVIALASSLNLDICIMNLSSSGLSDDRLVQLVSDIPEGAIMLIEDIDCIFQQRKKEDDKDTVTFSGLLNAIDGVMAGEGRILFLTTNHLDKLDAALIRPGRCDVHLNIGNASTEQARKLFLRFFPEHENEAGIFATNIKPDIISMAEIQGHLLQNRKNIKEALTNWKYVV